MESCFVCGGAPAQSHAVRRHVGMLIMQKFYKVNDPLCRNCGLSLTRQWTAKTLVQGWWGVFSMFFNNFVLVANGVAALNFRKMAPPTHDHLTSPEQALRDLNQRHSAGEVDAAAYASLRAQLLEQL